MCTYNVFALTFLTPNFPPVQFIQYLNDYMAHVSVKDFTMSPLSNESIGIIFGRNWVQRKNSMKLLEQNGVSEHLQEIWKKNCTGGII